MIPWSCVVWKYFFVFFTICSVFNIY
jgi:hypothetical protein